MPPSIPPLVIGLAVGLVAGVSATIGAMEIAGFVAADEDADRLLAILERDPAALLPAQRRHLPDEPVTELPGLESAVYETEGIVIRAPAGLARFLQNEETVGFRSESTDVVVFRYASCRPEIDEMYGLLPRLNHLDEELSLPGARGLVASLAALRSLTWLSDVDNFELDDRRSPRLLFDDIQIGVGGQAYLQSRVGRTEGRQSYQADIFLPAGDGLKSLGLLVRTTDRLIDSRVVMRMIQSLRVDDRLVLHCDRRSWPEDPAEVDALIRSEMASAPPSLR